MAEAKKIPTTGQDATLRGMENILKGYQCGSVYKPVYIEAQDAVAPAVQSAGKADTTVVAAQLQHVTIERRVRPPAGVDC
ncbi:hypothetical protein [Krasilnikovia sp. M28-CT-15]|uniref:hypothetical protein n=1 Tax=Krasilnikovia sp. M28-CT-15 TaxID=3373540 RepID=UPI003876DCA6